MGVASSLADAQATRMPSNSPHVTLGSTCDLTRETVNKGLPWQFFCDSDFAGNAEEQNRRRSQNCLIATCDGAPVLYGSKVSSVAFAHLDIGEAHADTSSGANEIYAAGNATLEAARNSAPPALAASVARGFLAAHKKRWERKRKRK